MSPQFRSDSIHPTVKQIHAVDALHTAHVIHAEHYLQYTHNTYSTNSTWVWSMNSIKWHDKCQNSQVMFCSKILLLAKWATQVGKIDWKPNSANSPKQQNPQKMFVVSTPPLTNLFTELWLERINRSQPHITPTMHAMHTIHTLRINTHRAYRTNLTYHITHCIYKHMFIHIYIYIYVYTHYVYICINMQQPGGQT